MNGAAVADTIAQQTKDLIYEGARKLNYKPNFLARSLRTGRSFTIGVMVPEVSQGYNATVLSGISWPVFACTYSDDKAPGSRWSPGSNSIST